MMHDLPEQFDERNMFLLAVLGLLSAAERLEDLIARYGRPRSASGRESGKADEEERARDHVLHLVLGALSLCDTVAARAREGRTEVEAGETSAAPPSPRLRRLLV